VLNFPYGLERKDKPPGMKIGMWSIKPDEIGDRNFEGKIFHFHYFQKSQIEKQIYSVQA
jgi:hypothetical protein